MQPDVLSSVADSSASDSSRVRRIAVLRALELGDLLCAVPAFRSLRCLFPDAHVTLIGLPWARQLVDRFPHYLDAHVEFPGFPGIPEQPVSPAGLVAFLAEAQLDPFDLAVQLHGSGLHSNAFVSLLGARRTAGFVPPGVRADPSGAGCWVPYPPHGHEVHRLLSLTSALRGPGPTDDRPEFPLTPTDVDDLAVALDRGPGELERRSYAVVHAGARDPARRWSAKSFATVADDLARGGLRIVLTGTAGEAPITRQVREHMRARAIDLAGETSMGALGALVDGARIVITNDTGVSHIAAGRRTPSVVVFLASDPHRWAPLDVGRHRSVGHPVMEAGCDHSRGPAHRCLGDACSNADGNRARPAAPMVTPQEVLAEARSLLATSADLALA